MTIRRYRVKHPKLRELLDQQTTARARIQLVDEIHELGYRTKVGDSQGLILEALRAHFRELKDFIAQRNIAMPVSPTSSSQQNAAILSSVSDDLVARAVASFETT